MENQKRDLQEEETRWHGLKSQISNLARFAVTPIPIEWITIISLILCGYSAAATGWGAGLLFIEGKSGDARNWWLYAGYLFGGIIALLVLLNVIDSHMSRVKLAGRDYQHLQTRWERFGNGFFAAAGRLSTIIFCAMFTYSQVSYSDSGKNKAQTQAKLEKLETEIAYKDSIHVDMIKYYRALDFDKDTTNDAWSRRRLDELERRRKLERQKEDSLLNVYTEILADTTTVMAAADGTRLLKDISLPEKPPDWTYKLLLAALSLLIGVITEGGIHMTGKIIGRHRAYTSVRKVYTEVEQALQRPEEDSLSKFSKFSRWFSSVNGGNRNGARGSGGEGFDWNSERIQDMLSYIRKNYRKYGGNKTQEQIGEHFGCGKSYVNQLMQAARNKKLLLEIGDMQDV